MFFPCADPEHSIHPDILPHQTFDFTAIHAAHTLREHFSACLCAIRSRRSNRIEPTPRTRFAPMSLARRAL